jgi:ethanolamine transporter EutH
VAYVIPFALGFIEKDKKKYLEASKSKMAAKFKIAAKI